jgi:hypothetical protein
LLGKICRGEEGATVAAAEANEELRSRPDDGENRSGEDDRFGATPMGQMMALVVIRDNRKRLHGVRYSPFSTKI